MGGIRKFKKNEKGENIRFITRNAAARKLQISLKLFRKLCIIKGIHPRDPKKKLQGKHKTYYYTKDIRYLQHEPIIQILRERRTFAKKEKKMRERKDFAALEQFIKNRPSVSLDHIVKERYPTFGDALKDLDDCLTLIHLFASMDSSSKVRENHVITCSTLAREFQHYVTASRSLRKVFVSIKGIYYQADIMGETITWLTPINYINKKEKKVDYGVMINFLEFYEVMMRFINYKLYTSIGLKYPPEIDTARLNAGEYLSAIKTTSLNNNTTITTSAAARKIKQQNLTQEALDTQKLVNEISKDIKEDEMEDVEESEDTTGGKLELTSKGISKDFEELVDQEDKDSVVKLTDQTNLFKGLKFFCSREVPKHALEFVIQSFGGEVSWEGGAFSESDQTVTHQIIDRNSQERVYHNREYVQPQWVFDSVNSQILMDVTEYAIGVVPPPHLSPFVEYDESSYIPARKQILDEMIQQKGFAAAKVDFDALQEVDDDDEDDDQEKGSDSEEEIDPEDSEDEEDIAAMEARYMKDLKREESGTSKKRKADEEEEEEEQEQEEEEEEIEDVESEEEEEAKLNKKKADKKKRQEQEELKLAEMMIPKKDKWLYNRINNRNEAQERNKNKLINKRKRIDSGKNVDGIPKSKLEVQERPALNFDHNYVAKPKVIKETPTTTSSTKKKSTPTNASKKQESTKPSPKQQTSSKPAATTKQTTQQSNKKVKTK